MRLPQDLCHLIPRLAWQFPLLVFQQQTLPMINRALQARDQKY